jgi:hypothetical protein
MILHTGIAEYGLMYNYDNKTICQYIIIVMQQKKYKVLSGV